MTNDHACRSSYDSGGYNAPIMLSVMEVILALKSTPLFKRRSRRGVEAAVRLHPVRRRFARARWCFRRAGPRRRNVHRERRAGRISVMQDTVAGESHASWIRGRLPAGISARWPSSTTAPARPPPIADEGLEPSRPPQERLSLRGPGLPRYRIRGVSRAHPAATASPMSRYRTADGRGTASRPRNPLLRAR